MLAGRRLSLLGPVGNNTAVAAAAGPLSTEQRWQPTALFGGSVTSLVHALSAPMVFMVLYAGTDVAAFFRSYDGSDPLGVR
jgi:hypothetical protein